MIEFPQNQNEVKKAFDFLEKALKENPLPRRGGQPSLGKADEFMFMHYDGGGGLNFKHIVTRNYLNLLATVDPEIFTVEIPKKDQPFYLGVF